MLLKATGSLKGSVSAGQVARFLLQLQRTLIGKFVPEDVFVGGTLGIEEVFAIYEYLRNEPEYNRDFCDFIQQRVPA